MKRGWHLTRPPEGRFTLNTQSPQAQGLIAWFPPLAFRGAGAIHDLSLHSWQGAWQGGAPAWETDPILGWMYRFDAPGGGSGSDHIEVGDIALGGDTGTMTGWFRINTNIPSDFNRYFIVGEGYDRNGIAVFREDSSTNRMYYYHNSTQHVDYDGDFEISVGLLYFCALSYDGATLTGYLAEESLGFREVLSTAETGNWNTGTWSIGAGADLDDYEVMNGRIGDVRWYDRPLSAVEIEHIYQPQTRWDLYAVNQPRLWWFGTTAAPVTVTPAAIELDFSTVNPTVEFGAVTITPAAATLDLSTVDPSVELGAVTVTPAAVTFDLTTVDPTVELGGVTITPTAATLDLTTENPTVVQGAVTVTPTANTIDLSTVNPTVELGAITLTPDPSTVTLSTVDPTVTTGGITITPDSADLALSTVDPTTVQGAITLIPDSADLSLVTVNPTVIQGAVTITPSVALLALTTVNPDVILGALTLTPTANTLALSTVDPTVIGGSGVTITPDAIGLDLSTVDPTVILGAVTITPTAIVLTLSTVDPSVGVALETDMNHYHIVIPVKHAHTLDAIEHTHLIIPSKHIHQA